MWITKNNDNWGVLWNELPIMTDNNIYRNKYYLKQTPETERGETDKVRGRERESGRERER